MTEEEMKKKIEELTASVDKLEANNKDLLAEKQQESDKRKAAEAEKKAAEEKTAAAEAEKLKTETDVEKVRQGLQKQLDKANERADNAEGKLKTLVTDSAIDSQLKSQGVPDNMLKPARLMIQAEQTIETGDDGAVKIGDKSAADWIKGWAESDAGSGFVVDGNGGGGAGGGGGKGKATGDGDKKSTANLIGSRDDRAAAVKEMFPDLPE